VIVAPRFLVNPSTLPSKETTMLPSTFGDVVIAILLSAFRSGFAFQPHVNVVMVAPPRRFSTNPRWSLPMAGASNAALPVHSKSEDEQQPPASVNNVLLAGKSPKAVKLRKEIQQIASDTTTEAPIVILGPKGSGKPSVVEDILQRLPVPQTKTIHRLNLTDALDLYDTMLQTLNILADQTNTTLVLTGFESRTTTSQDEFSKREKLEQIVRKLIGERTFQEKPFLPRILYSLHGTKEPEYLKKYKKNLLLIQVPALQSRVQDMAAIAQAEIQSMEKEYGLRNVLLTKEAIQRLLDHTWDQGKPELQEELRKALLRLTLERQRNPYLFEGPLPFLLEAKHMLVDTNLDHESSRRRLLYDFPILRRIIESPWIFDHLLRFVVTPVFALFLVILFWGPPTRDHNAALTVFWAGWWPAVMISFPLLGRIWCSICPFMAVGNLAQTAVESMGVQLKKWPKWVDTWGPLFAFGLFFVILVWEELWNLPESGALSAWLLLLITSGAVFNQVQFKDRVWCRHLCPIGAMCRTFGTMSMVEVRSFKANCQGCTNPQCVNGDSPVPQASDQFALKGCTMGLKNNQLLDMGHVSGVLGLCFF
jgi:hypothetical protein